MTFKGLVTACGALLAAALVEQCASKPAAPPPPELNPVVSVKELMENVVDPNADVVFDSVVTSVTAKGIVETKPTSDEDWQKVQHAVVTLAEATNLLKIPRLAAAPNDTTAQPGELTAPQVLAKIESDRAQWVKYADGLRAVAVKGMEATKAKDVNAVYELGSELDKACENCHLEYWYPGDKASQNPGDKVSQK